MTTSNVVRGSKEITTTLMVRSMLEKNDEPDVGSMPFCGCFFSYHEGQLEWETGGSEITTQGRSAVLQALLDTALGALPSLGLRLGFADSA